MVRFNHLIGMSIVFGLLILGCDSTSAKIPADTADYAVDQKSCGCPKTAAGVRQIIDQLEVAGAFGEHQLRPVENGDVFFQIQPKVSSLAITNEMNLSWKNKNGGQKKATINCNDLKVSFTDDGASPTVRWKWAVSKLWNDNIVTIDVDDLPGLIPKYVVETTVRTSKNTSYWGMAPIMF